MDSTSSLDYLMHKLPKQRKLYTFAPNLYGVELAHIDAIAKLAEWADTEDRPDAGLTDVLDEFARAHGWTGIGPSTEDADG